jgi:hypothetical protein
METYKCIPCDKIIKKTNKLNHESTEFHINNSLNRDNPFFKTCTSCKRVKNKTDFYDEKSKCKICLKEYKRGNVECKMCNTITTRNYYHKHMKKHPELSLLVRTSPELISINGKICSKCNIDKPKDSFHNDKYKEDGKKTICKECRKSDNRKLTCECDKEISFSNKTKHTCERVLNKEQSETKITRDSIKHIECTVKDFEIS